MRVELALWRCDYCDREIWTTRWDAPDWYWVPTGTDGVKHACDECAPVVPGVRRLGTVTVVKDLRCPEMRTTGQCKRDRGHDGGHAFP